MSRPASRWEWPVVGAITLGAAVLRLYQLGKVSPDPFYDAAVRSMTLSLHNFFFGAFEPGGSVSIDKPPIDLWLQVGSVKLLGFSSTTLKLPEAFAGIASVPLLFAAVRRMWSPLAGVAAAVGLAVLPVEVITSRSDTMDAVMMALTVLALLFAVRAVESGRTRWLLAAASALGVAFNVKLLESMIALPGIAVFLYLGLTGTRRRRLLRLLAAGACFVAVSLSWLLATLLVPASDRPYAIGSTNGSAWNAAFVFNGTDRLGSKSPEPQFTVYQPGHRYPERTQSQRDHIPITPPSPTRLLTRIGPLSGERLGLEVLVGLLLGIPALLWGLLRPGEDFAREQVLSRRPPAGSAGERAGRPRGPEGEAPPAPRNEFAGPATQVSGARAGGGEAAAGATVAGEPPARARTAGSEPAAAVHDVAPAAGRDDANPHDRAGHPRNAGASPRGRSAGAPAVARRMRRASAAGIGLWMLTGIALFSHMARLHPRYVEGFTPAVAAMLGIGVAWAVSARGRSRLAILAGALAVTLYYSERLLYAASATWWIAATAAGGALVLAVLARVPGPPSLPRRLLAPGGVMVLTLVCVLAVPLGADVTSIRTHVTDAGYVGALPTEEQQLVSAYLRAHQDGAYYELASESATQIGSLIVQDARPVLVLTSYGSRVFTTVPELEHQIALGRVRYAFLNSHCSHRGASLNPACSAPAEWVRAHGTDVSREAGLAHGKLLWRLPGVSR